MKIEAVVVQLTTRKYTGRTGVENTYYDAYLMDAEPNPMNRFPGQLLIRPHADDVAKHTITEGRKLTAHIMAVQELRNGVPVCQVRLESEPSPLPTKPAPAASK